LPHTDYGIAVYYFLATAEASANLARFVVSVTDIALKIRKICSITTVAPVKKDSARSKTPDHSRTTFGAPVTTSLLLRAQKVRELIAGFSFKAFEKVGRDHLTTSPVPRSNLDDARPDRWRCIWR